MISLYLLGCGSVSPLLGKRNRLPTNLVKLPTVASAYVHSKRMQHGMLRKFLLQPRASEIQTKT
jgi:hypothetical protein